MNTWPPVLERWPRSPSWSENSAELTIRWRRALTRVNRMGDILRDGTRNQQKRAINLIFDKILVGTLTQNKRS